MGRRLFEDSKPCLGLLIPPWRPDGPFSWSSALCHPSRLEGVSRVSVFGACSLPSAVALLVFPSREGIVEESVAYDGLLGREKLPNGCLWMPSVIVVNCTDW
jgi:hypothetical protein